MNSVRYEHIYDHMISLLENKKFVYIKPHEIEACAAPNVIVLRDDWAKLEEAIHQLYCDGEDCHLGCNKDDEDDDDKDESSDSDDSDSDDSDSASVGQQSQWNLLNKFEMLIK